MIDRRYQGKWSLRMLRDYCWALKRTCIKRSLTVKKQLFKESPPLRYLTREKSYRGYSKMRFVFGFSSSKIIKLQKFCNPVLLRFSLKSTFITKITRPNMVHSTKKQNKIHNLFKWDSHSHLTDNLFFICCSVGPVTSRHWFSGVHKGPFECWWTNPISSITHQSIYDR